MSRRTRAAAWVAVALLAVGGIGSALGDEDAPAPAPVTAPAVRDGLAADATEPRELIAADTGRVAQQTRARPVTRLSGRVTRVVDGDTIHVESRGFVTVVRLIGIDTPETVHPSKPVQCWGPQASAMTKRLLPVGTAVRLESDPSQGVRDRFGRFLGYVYRQNRRGAASINRALVAAGAAKSYVYQGIPFRFVRAFDLAETRAKFKRIGLWGPPCRGNIEQAQPRPAARPGSGPVPVAPAGNCDPNYAGACVPPYPPDVDCADIGRPVRVIGTDVHRFDRDGDGSGCESYG